MLVNRKLLNGKVEIDNTQTAQWYAQAEDWDCECGDCLNFLEVAKRGLLPSYIINLLEELHIPPTKATYVCLLDGEHLYQFSYRIAGTIINAENDSSGEVRCCHDPYPYGAPNFPTPHFDLEFYATLPWVFDEPQK